MIALIPTYILLKYGWRAIDVMKRMDLESRTPWYQHTLATVTGLSIIRTFKKENEAIDLFYELEDDNSSAYFLFFNSLRRVFELIVQFVRRNRTIVRRSRSYLLFLGRTQAIKCLRQVRGMKACLDG